MYVVLVLVCIERGEISVIHSRTLHTYIFCMFIGFIYLVGFFFCKRQIPISHELYVERSKGTTGSLILVRLSSFFCTYPLRLPSNPSTLALFTFTFTYRLISFLVVAEGGRASFFSYC